MSFTPCTTNHDPQLIQSWRAGRIDWHDLIPHHNGPWERFGESRDDKFNFMKLVMKEEMVTDYLTQYQDSGLAANFGKDYGPMRNYSGCNTYVATWPLPDHHLTIA